MLVNEISNERNPEKFERLFKIVFTKFIDLKRFSQHISDLIVANIVDNFRTRKDLET